MRLVRFLGYAASRSWPVAADDEYHVVAAKSLFINDIRLGSFNQSGYILRQPGTSLGSCGNTYI